MADEKIISVRLRALTADLESGMRRAGASIRGFQAAADRDMQALGNTLTSAGRAMTMGLTVPIAAGFALAVQQSISFESAMAGVARTMGLTGAQTQEMADGIRAMATELPASREEIAAVAEAAGQLGISRENVLEFTRTMIDLSIATNMTADEAAAALARFANITQMPQTQFDNLASSVVALGNAGASTESEIVAMALRLAAAGTQAGLTEGEIMGLAAALSDVGLTAELGGSNFSRVMLRMRDASIQGGEALHAFATAAGMSADAFAQMFRDNPDEAIARFVEGLHDITASGGTVTPILQGIGLRGSELADVLNRVSGAGDRVRDSMQAGEQAFIDNVAAAAEARRQYETTGAQIQVAWNRITDAAMSAGDIIAPIFADLASVGASVAQFFTVLPGPIQAAIIALLSFAAAIGPVTWLAGNLIKAWAVLSTAAPQVAAAITKIGSALVALAPQFAVAAAAAAAFWAAMQLASGEAGDQISSVVTGQIQGALHDMVEAMVSADDAVAGLAAHLAQGFDAADFDALADARIRVEDIAAAALEGGDAWQAMLDRLEGTGVNLQGLDDLAQQAQRIFRDMGETGALDAVQNALDGISDEAAAAAASTQALDGAWAALNNTLGDAEAAARARQALRDLQAEAMGMIEGGVSAAEMDALTISTVGYARALEDAANAANTNADGVTNVAAANEQLIRMMQRVRDDIPASMREMWDGMIRDIGGRPIPLRADGSQARQELQRTLAAMTPMERRQFLAFLRADGSQARTEAQNTTRKARDYAAGRYQGRLSADVWSAITDIGRAQRAADDFEGTYTATLRTVQTLVPLMSAEGNYFSPRAGGTSTVVAEAGYPEAVITSDPRYRARQLALLARLGFGQFAQPYAGLGTGATVGGGGTRVEYNFVVVRDTREAVAAVPSARREHARAFLDGRAG